VFGDLFGKLFVNAGKVHKKGRNYRHIHMFCGCGCCFVLKRQTVKHLSGKNCAIEMGNGQVISPITNFFVFTLSPRLGVGIKGWGLSFKSLRSASLVGPKAALHFPGGWSSPSGQCARSDRPMGQIRRRFRHYIR
jgi:hypothetical protein